MTTRLPVGISTNALIAPPLIALLAIGCTLAERVYAGANATASWIAIAIAIFFLATVAEFILLAVAVYALVANPALRSWRQSIGVAVGTTHLVLFLAALLSGGI